jgi:EAL domain-containing protein (putative c-di-GMP-specific phosphodiesterase class I)
MEFSVTASIGVSIFPDDGEDPHRLLKNADTAMYRSKRKGRERVEIFAPEMSDKLIQRVELDNKLRHAMEDGKLYLNYQPLMDARSNEMVGAEALLRWHDEELGDVSPEVFVPLAEDSGLIVDIGQWVLQQACADVKKWNVINEGDDMFVAVNLSGRQFRGKNITQQIADVLSQQELQGDHLELEITERLLMKDVPEVIDTLNQFKEMDIKLSIDDFGTGYSSLSYLKRFPFDVLKIDKSFVQDIGVDPDDESLCEAIIAMAHSLGLSVIAEGVETDEQLEFLRQRGAEIIQGYIVSKPMRHEDFIQFISVADWVASTA